MLWQEPASALQEFTVGSLTPPANSLAPGFARMKVFQARRRIYRLLKDMSDSRRHNLMGSRWINDSSLRYEAVYISQGLSEYRCPDTTLLALLRHISSPLFTYSQRLHVFVAIMQRLFSVSLSLS